jgi:hypothetical protein
MRRPDDPWFTVLYRDPHTLWWLPGAVVALGALLLDLLVFKFSAVHSSAVAALMGGSAAAGSYIRRRLSSRG